MEKTIRSVLIAAFMATVLLAFVFPLPCPGASPEELMQVGIGAFSDGFYHVAEAQFREFLQAYPKHPLASKVAYLLGKALHEQNKFKEAEGLFANQEHYQDSTRVTETIEEHRKLKQAISSLTEEWERLSTEAEEMKQKFDEAMSEIKVP